VNIEGLEQTYQKIRANLENPYSALSIQESLRRQSK
jgi:hypothetical protein